MKDLVILIIIIVLVFLMAITADANRDLALVFLVIFGGVSIFAIIRGFLKK
jgi:hypothetical protein